MTITNKTIVAIAILAIAGVVLSFTAFMNIAGAQVPVPSPGGSVPGLPTSPVGDVTGALDVVRNIVQVVYVLFFIIAILFVILAAFTYLTAGGNPEAVGKAKNQIIYAVVAIVVALISVGLDQIILRFLQGGT